MTLQVVYDSTSRICHIIDFRSGRFRDLPIISPWGKNQVPQMSIRSLQIAQNDDEYS